MDWLKRKLRGIGWCPHGKDSGSAPKPVDPYVQAGAQYGLNSQSAVLQNQLNRYNQISPTGNVNWTSQVDPAEQQRYDTALATYNSQNSDYQRALQTWNTTPHSVESNPNRSNDIRGGNGYNSGGQLVPVFNGVAPTAPIAPIASKWTQTTTLNPAQQRLFDLKQSNQDTLYQQASDSLKKPIDLSGLPDRVSNLGLNNDFSSERQKAEDALYQRSASRLDPQYKQTQSDLETKLYNQGIAPGTDAWQRELDNLARQKTDSYSQARNDAIGGAGQEQSRLFGMADTLAQQNAGLANQNRQQGLQELFSLRQSPLQEINLLEGRANNIPQGAQAPGTQVGTSDIGGAFGQQYQGELAGYNANVATNNANTGAGAAAASAIISAALI